MPSYSADSSYPYIVKRSAALFSLRHRAPLLLHLRVREKAALLTLPIREKELRRILSVRVTAVLRHLKEQLVFNLRSTGPSYTKKESR